MLVKKILDMILGELESFYLGDEEKEKIITEDIYCKILY